MKKGVTRIVFVFKRYVVKIPNFLYCHDHFLQGMCANWQERKYTRLFGEGKISPTVYCSWFGLFSIQRRVQPLNRDLTEEECKYFKYQTTDLKKENFGYLNGKLVCIDYA